MRVEERFLKYVSYWTTSDEENEQHPYTIDLAKQAIKNVGLDPLSTPVRGGTDGARLSFM